MWEKGRTGRSSRGCARRGPLVLLAVLASLVSGCGQPAAKPPAPPADTAGPADPVRPVPSGHGPVLSVRYEPPATAADRRDAAFLRTSRAVEEAAAALAGFLRWGARRPVPLVVRSCAGEGPSYDPEARRVEICYDEVAETRELFRDAGVRPAGTDADVRAVLLETLFHESAHALVDVLGLDVSALAPDGNEEDAADRFAALMLLRGGEPGERRLLAAAGAWQASAEVYEEAADDEHSSDRERAEAIRCWVYGAAPARRRALAASPDGPLPATRAAGCGEEWRAARTGWTGALRGSGVLG
ncbi:DUF4344 domain-containing metallopeptidase [Streptomyces sp. NPDC004111]|uniref:DUF4344 domain-containing metallopeptidase n=1 Tax=Streptomyces sp. NPDC004111 TaxID=3364690 RepID=UPI003687EBAB